MRIGRAPFRFSFIEMEQTHHTSRCWGSWKTLQAVYFLKLSYVSKNRVTPPCLPCCLCQQICFFWIITLHFTMEKQYQVEFSFILSHILLGQDSEKFYGYLKLLQSSAYKNGLYDWKVCLKKRTLNEIHSFKRVFINGFSPNLSRILTCTVRRMCVLCHTKKVL